MVTRTVKTEPAGPAPGAVDQAPAAPGSIDDFADQADQLQAGADPAAPGQVEPAEPAEKPQPTNTELLASAFVMIRETTCEVAGLQSPRQLLTDEKVERLAVIWGEVCDHYGLVLSESVGKYTVIMLALGASFKVMSPVIAATRAEIATKDKAPKKIAPPAAVAPIAVAPAANESGLVKPTWPQ